MKTTLESILLNPLNEKVLKFLGIRTNRQHSLISFEDKKFYSHEGLENFLDIDLPTKSKYMLDNQGLIIIQSTGEIIAFEFGRFNSAFKIKNPEKYYDSQKANRLFPIFKSRNTTKVSVGYFSNENGDPDTIIDIRELGECWALSINFVGQSKKKVQEFYKHRMNV